MQGENYPPLHPRCRCTVTAALGEDLPIKRRSRIAERREKLDGSVTYKEWLGRYVEKAEQQNEKVKAALQAVMVENNIRGELMYPPPKIDFSAYRFDKEHTQGDLHPHNVNEEEARRFIRDAYFLLIKYNGNSYNYYGAEGAAFVRMDLKTIRTAFKAEEYDDKIKKLIEVCENGR